MGEHGALYLYKEQVHLLSLMVPQSLPAHHSRRLQEHGLVLSCVQCAFPLSTPGLSGLEVSGIGGSYHRPLLLAFQHFTFYVVC